MQVGTLVVALPGAHSASVHVKQSAGKLEQTFQFNSGQAPAEAVLQWAAFDARCQSEVSVSSGTLIALVYALNDDSPKRHPLQVTRSQQMPAG
jgi:hypothetical protein